MQSPDPLASKPFDNSDELITAMVLAFVTGVTQLWEIDAAPKKGLFEQMQEAQAIAAGQDAKAVTVGQEKKKGVWVVPKAVDGASMMVPKKDIKVRIRRRENLPAKVTIGRI